jgi:hypothetical protein
MLNESRLKPSSFIKNSVGYSQSGIVLLASGFLWTCVWTSNFSVSSRNNGVTMSLAARKSDLKQHLSHKVKKHLLSPDLEVPQKLDASGERVANASESAVARIDLGQRPSSESIGGSEPVVPNSRNSLPAL